MPEEPFTTIGDEAIEARIVAWVLGEASAFEIAELERLCEERPELMIFKRRMQTLHGLIGEAEKPHHDQIWKLSAAKCAALLDQIAPDAALPETLKEARVRYSAMRSILSIAACLIVTVIILGLSAPMVMRQRKKSDVASARSMAMQRELTALEEEMEAGDRMMTLRTELPAERIEGTPKPIILPEKTPSKDREMPEMAKNVRQRSIPTGESGPPSKNEPADNQVSSDTLAVLDKEKKREAIFSGKPSGPSSSMSRVSASSGVSDMSIPVPEVDLDGASPNFGGGDDFGTGWGDASDKAGGGYAHSNTSGKRVGNMEIQRGDIGAPVDERHGELKMDDVSPLGAASAPPADYWAPAQAEGKKVRGEIRKGYSSEDAFKLNDLASRREAQGHDSSVNPTDGLAQAGEKSDRGFPATPATPPHLDGRSGAEEKRAEWRNYFPEGGRRLDSDLEQEESMTENGLDSVMGLELAAQENIDPKSGYENEKSLLEVSKSKPAKMKEPEPERDLTQLIEELSAAEAPYSTFSLNISDASFRIAQAAMAKGERPDPAGIKVEQFYNAVDYGDPAPAAGEPVACMIEQAAHPVIPGRNLVRVSLKTAAAGRSAAQPLRLTLLVDQSGSMSRADRRAAMNAAMAGLGSLLTDQDLVTVIGFSRTPRLLADGLKGDQVGKKLAGLVNQLASEGGTNLEEAIKLAEQKAMSRKLAGAQNRIVLFTDGAANLGDADPQRLAAKVEQLRQQGIAFDIAGIAADDLNDELLGELARKGNGRYSIVGKGEDANFAKQLAGAFRPAAENVKVQVRFNPERVARYKLIGFEKDRLKTEDFRNDAVDAAELAAEEAGVAVYQVEPIPDGRGEIGEVSVRFRDTARGEMVERMWTMTHNASAPAIDQAAPSMQLATLAMLAGEKLKGGPLADAIDFKQLAEPQAIVKQTYGQDPRVAEMLRMVDALK